MPRNDDRNASSCPLQTAGVATVCCLLPFQQASERNHVRLEPLETRALEAEVPDTGASCADPDIDPPRREIVQGGRSASRHRGMAGYRIGHPGADGEAAG